MTDTKEITKIETGYALEKPREDTAFAHEAAKLLVDIIKKNGWAYSLGGKSQHLGYEAWQTAGKYYGYTVKTLDAEYVELAGTWGFKARAVVVNEHTGVEVGSADAYCMSDEANWGRKPKFQLASMAQTRAGSKALRQILGFVVALAGYSPTPAEEMGVVPEKVTTPEPVVDTRKVPIAKLKVLYSLGDKLGNSTPETQEKLREYFHISVLTDMTEAQADEMIMKMNNRIKEKSIDSWGKGQATQSTI